MRRISQTSLDHGSASGLALVLSALAACAPPATGGVTAQLSFPELERAEAARTAGTTARTGRGLRAQALRPDIGRLEILCVESGTSTLASTNLYLNPGEGQLGLDPAGGTWRLDQVPIGTGRRIIARAYLRASPDPRIGDLLLFAGSSGELEVRSGETSNAGLLELFLVPGVRYPALDDQAPDPPNPATAIAAPEGEALRLEFSRPAQPDVAGYLIAVGTDALAPELGKGELPAVGELIGGDLTVVRQLWSPVPEPITISGLQDGRPYRVLVYAFDSDLYGAPLNYSAPTLVFGTPEDRVAPGPALDMLAAPAGPGAIEFTFTAPGEDDGVGTPTSYEVKVASARGVVENVETFRAIPQIVPPGIRPGGEQLRFTRTYAELRLLPGNVFLGIRATDRAGNVGPIAVVGYTVNATLAPSLREVVPPIATAGGLASIHGANFGARQGAVTITSDDLPPRVFPVTVTGWTATEISIRVPDDARTGTLTVTRVADAQTATAFLPIIARFDAAFTGYEAPFELLAALGPGAPGEGPQTVGALYRERDVGIPYQGAIERIFGETPEGLPFAPQLANQRSTAIAGTHVPGEELFFFVASNEPLSMTAAFVSTSTTTTRELRIPSAVGAGGADRVSVVALPGGAPGTIPAMIAFTRDGVVRTATVNDALTQSFIVFTASTATTAGVTFDRVTLAQNAGGHLALAYRAVDALGASLVLAENGTQDPAGFELVDVPVRPNAGPNFELLTGAGGALLDDFILVYEEVDDAGRTDIRVLGALDYGLERGYAPFELDPSSTWRLEDAGLVYRNQTIWIAILATRIGAGFEARYTEVPLTVTRLPETRRGEYPGVVLDNASLDARARIGCREAPLEDCPFVWLGDSAQLLFIRR